MKYFTSDLHLGFEELLHEHNGAPARPFQSVEEMNHKIVENINKTCTSKDTLYILGDVACKGYNPVKELKQIQCAKILILGNHDGTRSRGLMSHRSFRNEFEAVYERKAIWENDIRITMCHYPMLEWDGYWKKGWLFYGHVHHEGLGPSALLKHYPTAVNVGIDIHHRPKTAMELVQWKLENVVDDEFTRQLCPFYDEVRKEIYDSASDQSHKAGGEA